MVAVQIAEEAIGQPGWRVVCGEGNGQVSREIADIGCDGFVELLKLGVDSPVLALP